MAKTLVTGAAGFIGFHLCNRLLADGHELIGLDNLNDYYDVSLKQARLNQLTDRLGFQFKQLDLADRDGMATLFKQQDPEMVVHLAAQAGVRYSITHPHAYIDSNLIGFANILEGCRHGQVKHLVYASSSSVYGANRKIPFSEGDRVDNPVSLYAATKKANELMAHTYSHLYKLPTTGLRFFTVYGPWGRPDMAYFSFTRAILARQPIKVFNYGKMRRDFTYIDDIVEGIVRVMEHIPQPQITPDPKDQLGDQLAEANTALAAAPYQVYNIGNNRPVELLRFIEVLENCLGIKAEKQLMPLQPGDVLETYADIDALNQATGFAPETPLETGLAHFVDWYKSFYKV